MFSGTGVQRIENFPAKFRLSGAIGCYDITAYNRLFVSITGFSGVVISGNDRISFPETGPKNMRKFKRNFKGAVAGFFRVFKIF